MIRPCACSITGLSELRNVAHHVHIAFLDKTAANYNVGYLQSKVIKSKFGRRVSCVSRHIGRQESKICTYFFSVFIFCSPLHIDDSMLFNLKNPSQLIFFLIFHLITYLRIVYDKRSQKLFYESVIVSWEL